tara:strand:- start:13664 stop:15193 length:1530 start_codon:yes stop_codon:yes gene_type:complete
MSEPDFLEVGAQFQLGMLDTERPHPKTKNLSSWARSDLSRAIQVLKEVDQDALALFEGRIDKLEGLAVAIRQTLDRGDKVFLCGCGATGRLSISLEIFARGGLLKGATDNNVIGFMAGGDAALIRSIERFEDRPDFGERQLLELGFSNGDLLISSTEGGETPFVIGATEAAAKVSVEPPYFLYCNPDRELREHVERSRAVLDNQSVRKVNLAVGPMALSGSTRMQASTVLMAAIGFAMQRNPAGLKESFQYWQNWALKEVDWNFLAAFIEAESQAYQKGEYLTYDPGPYGITILTDTTERSPTFTLTPFERNGEGEKPSLCYLRIPEAQSAEAAWLDLLGRNPRPLEWGELKHLTNAEALAKFDFSRHNQVARDRRLNKAPQRCFRFSRDKADIVWAFGGLDARIPVPGEMDSLGENLLIKMLLNVHSTLVMGRLGRYAGNVMTYVSANNFKLIDRSIRYVMEILETQHGVSKAYNDVAMQLVKEKQRLQPDEPIVLRTVEAILKKNDA